MQAALCFKICIKALKSFCSSCTLCMFILGSLYGKIRWWNIHFFKIKGGGKCRWRSNETFKGIELYDFHWWEIEFSIPSIFQDPESFGGALPLVSTPGVFIYCRGEPWARVPLGSAGELQGVPFTGQEVASVLSSLQPCSHVTSKKFPAKRSGQAIPEFVTHYFRVLLFPK